MRDSRRYDRALFDRSVRRHRTESAARQRCRRDGPPVLKVYRGSKIRSQKIPQEGGSREVSEGAVAPLRRLLSWCVVRAVARLLGGRIQNAWRSNEGFERDLPEDTNSRSDSTLRN